jgi:hypothetical protein
MINDANRVRTTKSVDLCSCGFPFTYQGFTSSECGTDPRCRNYVACPVEPVTSLDDATADYLSGLHGHVFFQPPQPVTTVLGTFVTSNVPRPGLSWAHFSNLQVALALPGEWIGCSPIWHPLGHIVQVDILHSYVGIHGPWNDGNGNPLQRGDVVVVRP